MKYPSLLLLIIQFYISCITLTFAQENTSQMEESLTEEREALSALIDQYVQARETRDTSLLNEILTEDIDQLVSSGEWRRGIETAKVGMMRSSYRNPGKRTIEIENVRMIQEGSGIIDARYEIQQADGNVRKMWSTFIVVLVRDQWKITAIRNMLPDRR